MRLALLLLMGAALGAADFTYYLSGSGADAQTARPGGYLLIGGGRDDPEAFRWFLQQAPGGDVLILRASGADGYHAFLAELGPVDSLETIVFHAAAAARDPFVLERIRQADAIFLAGGNQWNYVRWWRGTPVAAAVDEAARRGVPVGGTSAGLAVLGEFGFSAEHGSVTSAEAEGDPGGAQVALVRGLFHLPGLECLITDSHFSERNRMGRLRVFVTRLRAACPEIRGLGLDERTALLVERDGSARVVGRGGAFWLRWQGGQIETVRWKAGDRVKLRP